MWLGKFVAKAGIKGLDSLITGDMKTLEDYTEKI